MYYVKDPTVPSFGYSSSLTASAGRVYIGQFDIAAGVVSAGTLIPYAYNGIYDSGWVGITSWGLGASGTAHRYYLATTPTWVNFMCKQASGDVYINPMAAVRIQHVDDIDNTTWEDTIIPVPTFDVVFQSDRDFKLRIYNPTSDGMVYREYDGGTKQTTSSPDELRVIMGR